MPCFHPIRAWYPEKNSGVKTLIFQYNPLKSPKIDGDLQVPCGQCIGCRLERSRQWAVRCMHEAQLHKDNCFITLTFSPEALAERKNPMSVDVRDFQLFMKRLRKKYGEGIRFYHCGEYGEKSSRPHYHACLFGFDFADKRLWKITNGSRLYTSESLSELWSYGFSTIGDVTFESAAYVARYIMKKINGEQAENHYYDRETGEVINPEYTTMSRRPGIGRGWLDKYVADVYPHDYVVVNGIKCKPPKYYDGVLSTDRPYEFDEIKNNRLTRAEKHVDNNTPDRLDVRERVSKARLKLLPKNLD